MYTYSVVAFGLFFNLSIPVLTAIYRDNYADIIRGRVFGITTSAAVISGIITQYVGGQVLDLSLEWYRYVFSALSFLVAVGAFAIVRMPSNHQGNDLLGNPLSYFGLLRKYTMFRYVLIAWFLFGAANFALMPQRIEYLTQPEYGLEYNAALVFLVVGVSVECARLLAIQVWAYLFDHFNFIKLRILITSFILAFLLVFFHAKSLPMLMLGAALQGCAFGGGIIAWTLWVTKFAPKEQTTQFMAIHTFATGVRGTIAPLVGYGLAGHFGIHTAVWFSVSLTIVSMAMLWRIAGQPIRMAGVSSE
jgi:MFS family permease